MRPITRIPMIALLAASVATAASGQTSETVNRRFDGTAWPQGSPLMSVSADGRYGVYTNFDADGALELVEVASGEVRTLTPEADLFGVRGQSGWAQASAISRDGERVAYEWYNGTCGCYELRTIGVDGSSPEVLHANPRGPSWIQPTDWSPDGTGILVVMSAGGGASKIAVFPAAGGSARTLKSVDWRSPERPRFSPDGRYIAYDLPAEEGSRARDVFVLAVDGSRETVVTPGGGDDRFLEWTPDGDILVLRDDASAAPALWLEQIRDGRRSGDGILIRPEMRNVLGSLGLTDAGSLYYRLGVGRRQLFSAPFHGRSGSVTGAPAVLSGGYRARTFSGWSRDGEFVAFIGDTGGAGISRSTSIIIRTLASGALRELTPDFDYIGSARWSADGQSFLVSAQQQQRPGLFRVDAHTGEVTRLLSGTQPLGLRLSPDGRTAYYHCRACSSPGVYAYDLDSGDVREVWSGKVWSDGEGREVWLFYQQLALSPDGRQLALVSYRHDGVMLMPTAGGPPRAIFRVVESGARGGLGEIRWMPDGEHLLAAVGNPEDSGSEASGDLWRISVVDGAAERLTTLPMNARGLDLHPDGRQVVFVAGEEKLETWVLDHVIPSRSATADSKRREDRE